MIEYNDGINYINVFNNISELSKYVEKKERKSGRDAGSSEEGQRYFYGTNNFEEALELLRYGDDDLYKKVIEEKSKIKVDKMLGNARNRQTYFNNISGCIPNVPNYLIGNPQNMIDIKKNGASQKIINVILNIRVPSGVDADDVIKIGTKYISIIDVLEKSGYRCNLYSAVANTNSSNSKHSLLMVKIKNDREPLNIKKICFAVAHPSMQRRITALQLQQV